MTTAFKRAQIKHKRHAHAPDRLDDLPDLVDFANADDDRIRRLTNVPQQRRRCDLDVVDAAAASCHCDDIYTGPMYTLNDTKFPSGFLYAPNALTNDLQQRLAYEAVTQLCEAPHGTNMGGVADAAGDNSRHHGAAAAGGTLWHDWKVRMGFVVDEDETSSRTRGGGGDIVVGPRKKQDRCFNQLSWSTLGYHYDWTQRAYPLQQQSPLPDSVTAIATLFARTAVQMVSLPHVYGTPPSSSTKGAYVPTAVIVNYYHPKSQMGGHRDDLELALDQPIVSWSLGRPAVFLLGGATKHDVVCPVLVRPGDVMIMAGAARLAYHGMARLLPSQLLADTTRDQDASSSRRSTDLHLPTPEQQVAATVVPTALPLPPTDVDHHALRRFLLGHRINVNVRQVYPE